MKAMLLGPLHMILILNRTFSPGIAQAGYVFKVIIGTSVWLAFAALFLGIITS